MGTDLLSGLSVEHALHTFGILPHSKTLIRCVEATDHDPRCQRLLLAFGDRIEHVYGDLMDRIVPEKRDIIEGLPWPNKSEVARDSSGSLKIGMDSLQEATATLAKDAFRGGYTKDIKTGEGFKIGGDLDDVPTPDGPLGVTMAGVPCIDHSAIGTRTRFWGPTTLTATVFSQERKARQHQEHFIFTECAPDWEPLALKGALYPSTTIQSTVAELHDFRFPVPRKVTLVLVAMTPCHV